MSAPDRPGQTDEPAAARARREARRTRRLGPDAACATCGVKTPEALVRLERTILEKHHAAGRANDVTLTVVLCRNCHAIATEAQRTHGAPLGQPDTILDRAIGMLRSLSAFFDVLADALAWLADMLANLLRALCVHHEGWHAMPEATA